MTIITEFRMASMHIGTRGKSLNNVYHAPRLPAHAPWFRSEHMLTNMRIRLHILHLHLHLHLVI